MNIAGMQNAMVGMAIFDLWDASFKKSLDAHKPQGSPLLAAATKAFEAYAQRAEVGFAAQIAGTAVYALNPGGGSAGPVTAGQIAPFLALNAMG